MGRVLEPPAVVSTRPVYTSEEPASSTSTISAWPQRRPDAEHDRSVSTITDSVFRWGRDEVRPIHYWTLIGCGSCSKTLPDEAPPAEPGRASDAPLSLAQQTMIIAINPFHFMRHFSTEES